MTEPAQQAVSAMTEDECWNELSGRALGRLAICVDGQPDVFPVNFAVQQRTIVVRSAEGTKLSGAAVNHRVAFEVDDHDVATAWSIVVKGRARILSSGTEIAHAERAQVLPWTATTKLRFIRIEADAITGRRFRFGTEPDDHLYG